MLSQAIDLVRVRRRLLNLSQQQLAREAGVSFWRSALSADNVTRVRDAFRKLLTAPIRLTPVIERGYRAVRFEGRIGLAAVFEGVVTNVASQGIPSWNQISEFLKAMQGLRAAGLAAA